MKKTGIVLALGGLAFLQACGNAPEDHPAAPAADTMDTDRAVPAESAWVAEDGNLIIAEGEIALGHDGMMELTGMTQNPIIAGSIGLGVNDVTLCGDGRNAGCTGACPAPCLVPGNPVGCGACPSRGAFAASLITANLTLTNTSGGAVVNALEGQYGVCSGETDSVCTVASDCLPVVVAGQTPPIGINNTGERGCNGLPVLSGGTVGDPADVSTIADGIMNGFCQDGTTLCDATGSDLAGNNTACGGKGTCSDNGADCSPGFDLTYGTLDDVLYACTDPLTATCTPPVAALIGDGKCWSGCGTCTGGRDLRCASFVYGGSNLNAGPATGDTKCTGAPYSINNPSNIGVANLDSIVIGAVGVGAAVPFTFLLNAGNNSYCVHRFQIREQPFGDVDDSAIGDICNTTCGDGVVALLNGEICEPRPADTVAYANVVHSGCGVNDYYCYGGLEAVPPALCAGPGVDTLWGTADDDTSTCADPSALCRGAICTACTTCGPRTFP